MLSLSFTHQTHTGTLRGNLKERRKKWKQNSNFSLKYTSFGAFLCSLFITMYSSEIAFYLKIGCCKCDEEARRSGAQQRGRPLEDLGLSLEATVQQITQMTKEFFRFISFAVLDIPFNDTVWKSVIFIWFFPISKLWATQLLKLW